MATKKPQATPQSQPPKPKRYLEIKPADRARIAARKKAEEDRRTRVDPEWSIIAEYGLMYGHDGIEAILGNRIGLDEVITLIDAGRRLEARKVLDLAHATFVATAAAHSGKKAPSVMQKGLKSYRKAAGIN